MRLGISIRLTLVFAAFAALVLAGMGAVAFINARTSLHAATVAELTSTAIEKQSALDAWMSDRQGDVVSISRSAHLQDEVAALIEAGKRPRDPSQPSHVLEDLRNWVGPGQGFRELLILDPLTGQVLAATDAGDVGKFKEDREYFIQGRLGPFVQNPYHDLSLAGSAATAAAPIRAVDGRLLAVLAGHLDLTEMDAIISRRTGLHLTDESFLVNTAGLLVTQPRLLTDPSVLQRVLRTEAVGLCLQRESGTLSALDYRDVPAVIVYRWLPQRNLCLITTIDEEEALAAERTLGRDLLVAGCLLLLVAAGVSYWLSRTFTFPIRRLTAGAVQVGQGNLDYRIRDDAGDEIGDLARAFNGMTASLSRSRGETAQRQRLLVALGEAAQAVQRSASTAEVYQILAGEVARLGYVPLLARVTPDGKRLTSPYVGLDEDLLRAAEDLLALSPAELVVTPAPGAYLDQAMREKPGVFVESADALLAETLPETGKPLAGQLASLLKVRQAIVAPLVVDGQVQALLTVAGVGLTEADLPAVTALASQAAIALANARLYQETLAWAAEMEARVRQRTGELQVSEERYRRIFENAPIGIFHSLPNGRYARVNPAYAAMLGYDSPENMVASITDITRQVHVDPNRRATILAKLAGADGWVREETSYRRRDGGLVVGNLSLRKQLNDDGSLAYMEGLVEDITERKKAEENLKAFSVDLERSNKELEQFAYVASHDLQEPLRQVASFTQLLARRYGGRLDADADEFIGFAVDGANRMQVMINDLLSFSRVGSRGQAFRSTDLAGVLDGVLGDLHMTIEEAGAVVTHDPMPTVIGDEAQLGRLFQNLIENAIKFRGKETPRVHLSAVQTAEGWEFAVTDKGIGIDPRYFDRIFIIFQRLNQRKAFPGTGIGLAICKKIVERHHGRIWVTAEPGKGSTFHFTLPARSVAA